MTAPIHTVHQRLICGAGFLAKLFLSCFLASGFFLVVHWERVWAQSSQARPSAPTKPIAVVQAHVKHSMSTIDLDGLVPKFPFRNNPLSNRIVVNGLSCAAESWDTSANAAEVIDFYRASMVSLGWSDETEEAYHLRPEAHAEGAAADGLQNEDFLQKYNEIKSSRLVLCREGWTVQVFAGPKDETPFATVVGIVASPTSSVSDLIDTAAATFSPDASRNGAAGGLGFEEQTDGNAYHTTVRFSPRDPEAAFREKLSDLRAQGWQPVFSSMPAHGEPKLFAFLVYGNRSAYLCAAPPAEGAGATLTMTDVTPERDAAGSGALALGQLSGASR